MAPTSRKKRSSSPQGKSSERKRTGQKRNPAKRKKKKKSSRPKQLLKIVLLLLVAVLLVGIGYCLGTCGHSQTAHSDISYKQHVPKHLKPTLVKKPVHKTEHKPVVKKEAQHHPSPSVHETREKVYPKVRLAYRGEKPKLVIIIDDVHTQAQLDAIGALGFPVTPSIFPPYSMAPHTEKLATRAVHYMIHLPLESGNVKFNTQSKTLMTTASRQTIEARVRQLRRLFPRAHYINNHTGSVFTRNYHAMYLLYEAMKKEGFAFIDSRTISDSKVEKIAHAFGDAYVARDIFIDNVHSVPYIHKQLKKAVVLAKRNGYTIAIGHPHKATMEALRTAKPLLKGVEAVYIDSIFREE